MTLLGDFKSYYDYEDGKEKVYSGMPSGVRIVHSSADSKCFHDKYKTVTKPGNKNEKMSLGIEYENIISIIESDSDFDYKEYKPRRRKYKDDEFNEEYIKDKEEYYFNQFEGSLEYLDNHFKDFDKYAPSFLWISDLTILYKCLILKLRNILIEMYKTDKVQWPIWDFTKINNIPYYICFNDEISLGINARKLKEYGIDDVLCNKYLELGRLLLKTDKQLKNNNIIFKRNVLSNKTILKYGK